MSCDDVFILLQELGLPNPEVSCDALLGETNRRITTDGFEIRTTQSLVRLRFFEIDGNRPLRRKKNILSSDCFRQFQETAQVPVLAQVTVTASDRRWRCPRRVLTTHIWSLILSARWTADYMWGS